MFSLFRSFFLSRFSLEGAKKFVVSLSGGADSVLLLHFMLRLQREEKSFLVEAFHLNHSLRGEESERDERFVVSLCERLSVPLHLFREDVSKLAKGRSIEDAARDVRYGKLLSLLGEGEYALTGHTLSDSIETALLGLFVGNYRWLSGVRFSAFEGKVLRPLLCFSRKEVRDELRRMGEEWVEDSSNYEGRFLRNRARRVLEFASGLFPSLEKAAGRCLSVLQEEFELLDRLAEEEVANRSTPLGMRVEPFPSMRVLFRYLGDLGFQFTFDDYRRLKSEGRIERGGKSFRISSGFLHPETGVEGGVIDEDLPFLNGFFCVRRTVFPGIGDPFRLYTRLPPPYRLRRLKPSDVFEGRKVGDVLPKLKSVFRKFGWGVFSPEEDLLWIVGYKTSELYYVKKGESCYLVEFRVKGEEG